MVTKPAMAEVSADPRTLLSVKRFARTIDVGLTKAWALIRDKEVEVVRLGGRTLVVTHSVDALIQRKLQTETRGAA